MSEIREKEWTRAAQHGKKLSRQRRWQIKRVKAGKCQSCGLPRGRKGSKLRCDTCNGKYRKESQSQQVSQAVKSPS